ncbi:hypothetical protein P154DRAFT_525609 [Amniculicola lignicola CBS 123094]|uniref:Uncharacterized protein n=1 Tax=Amniculicola lignicola CBS 123094 TaxID=1392246 RepID=A0A6A5W898_9PLEO|nr:hypothetical protein P154DRAFT_525609 [Amniculicola lignicola CBS 123094]
MTTLLLRLPPGLKYHTGDHTGSPHARWCNPRTRGFSKPPSHPLNHPKCQSVVATRVPRLVLFNFLNSKTPKMSGTPNNQPSNYDDHPPPPLMTKQEEAATENNQTQDAEHELEEGPPPAYTHSGSTSSDIRAFNSLALGDPDEQIAVPMILSREKKTFAQSMFGGKGKVTQTVIVRKMPRKHYLAKYAHDADGNYVGSEKPAADAGLVFVPSKSTPEEVLEQVRKVAFGREHYANDMPGTWSGVGVGFAAGGV